LEYFGYIIVDIMGIFVHVPIKEFEELEHKF